MDHPRCFVTGGQKSGKSREAERRALAWQRAGAGRRVSVIATALPADAGMRARITRHRAERPAGFTTLEVPHALASTLAREDDPAHLLLVDCLTLWLTQWRFPPEGHAPAGDWEGERAALLATLPRLRSPWIIVGNEIGAGLLPLDAATRAFVDELGTLNQRVAACGDEVLWMVAGQCLRVPVRAEENA